MKVSIIIPVFNVLPYLQRCLDSIVNQTLKDIEIIIVDDGSTDGSSEFVDTYSKRDARISVLHKENGGLMSAWVTGVKESHGDYIGFVDSDDYALSEMYERLYGLAVENDVDIVVSNYLINARKKGSHPILVQKYTGKELEEVIRKHVFPSPITYSISMQRMPKLYKRHIIIDNLKYTSSLSRTFEDRYIVPAALLSAKSVYYTDEAYYCWMLRSGSNHGMYKEHLLDDIKRVYEVQHQVVLEKNKVLLPNWELAYLDFIRLYIDRNVIRIRSLRTKLKSINVLFRDQLTKQRFELYGGLMKGKLGVALRVSMKLNSPFILAMFSYLVLSEE